MAFDAGRGVAVLFGGSDGPLLYSDTWEWNGVAGTWTLRTPSGSVPPARTGAAIAYDSVRGRVVLFGGRAGAPLGDTWEWDGGAGTWTLRQPAVTPAPRSGAAMAYDVGRQRVVLFGGMGATALLQDTWEWDGAAGVGGSWTQRFPASPPPARDRHCAVFDAARAGGGRVIVFGGLLSDQRIWEWDGTAGAWTERAATPPAGAPAGRAGAAMAYDTLRGRAVLFGGTAGLSHQNDTWEWDGAAGTWTQVSPALPPGARSDAAMVFDAARARCTLFGGVASGTLGDTHEYSPGAGPVITAHPAGATVAAGTAAELTAGAAGTGSLVYRWRRAGSPLADGGPISGAATATLRIDPVAPAHAGSYDVLVTDACGSAASAPATLTVSSSGCGPADFDHNGLIQPADIALFVNTWSASLAQGTLAGDFDGNGAVQPADLAAFVNAWFAAIGAGGC
jgi:hypothetical protein